MCHFASESSRRLLKAPKTGHLLQSKVSPTVFLWLVKRLKSAKNVSLCFRILQTLVKEHQKCVYFFNSHQNSITTGHESKYFRFRLCTAYSEISQYKILNSSLAKLKSHQIYMQSYFTLRARTRSTSSVDVYFLVMNSPFLTQPNIAHRSDKS